MMSLSWSAKKMKRTWNHLTAPWILILVIQKWMNQETSRPKRKIKAHKLSRVLMIESACRPPQPTEQTEVLGSKENYLAEVEPAADNVNDPWKTLAPGDTIEDIRLQPQPPVPKFKSRVVSLNFVLF
jgi:hypothetical protein